MNQRQEDGNMSHREVRTTAFFTQQGVHLRFKMILEPHEVHKFIQGKRNFVVASTFLHPRSIPELLYLNKERIAKDGFLIEINKVEDHFWKDKKIANKDGGTN